MVGKIEGLNETTPAIEKPKILPGSIVALDNMPDL